MRIKSGFPWGFTLIWLPILCLMVWAGFWQLDRANQKERIHQQMTQGQVVIPQQLSEWQSLNDFQAVRLKGQFNDMHFILANQFHDSRVGYLVYSAFLTHNDLWLLVNRGWTASPDIDLSIPKEVVQINGYIAAWPRPGIQLGEQVLDNVNKQTVTYLPLEDTKELMSNRLCQSADCEILSRVIKLDSNNDYGFVRDWQAPMMTAARHRAYAFQWFMMSLALCLIYVYFLWKHHATKK